MAAKSKPNTQKRALLVDDDIPILRALDARLTHSGYAVDAMRDASSALSHAAQYPPDVALLDINMPGLDGFQMAERMRVQHPDCSLFFITAGADDDVRARAAALGGVLHEKPFNSEDLLGDLQAALA